MANPLVKAMLPMVRNFITDEKLSEVFDKLTDGVTPAEGENLCLIITKRKIMGEQRPVMSVCTGDGMTITGIHRQYTTDDLKKIVENV